MDRRAFAASVFAAAVSLASTAALTSASAQSANSQQQANKKMAMAEHLQKCYGVNAIGRNDCAAGAHSCAGQATKADDPNSFVLLPHGDCGKIAGGSLSPA